MNSLKNPSFTLSIVPVLMLIILLIISVRTFGSNSLDGANQLTLITAAAVCVAISLYKKQRSWKELEHGVIHNVSQSTSAILILFFIGSLSGTWMISGIVPSMIYYGMQLIHPTVFLLTTCLLCSIVSVASGSSWTTVATIGIAMMGIGKALGYSDGWIAGAILSGAYFGDKISPISDTTNLAATISGTDLFTHVRYMLYTTIPSITIALLIFAVAGFVHHPQGDIDITQFTQALENHFYISPFLFIVPIITFILILKKVPATITLFLSTLMGSIVIAIAQPHFITIIGGEEHVWLSGYRTISQTIFGSTSIDTGNEMLNELVSTRGMAGMLNTIWLIIAAMIFGGVMEASGMLEVITQKMITQMKSTFTTVFYTAFSGLFTNLTTSDQYLSIIIPAKMFASTYKQKGLPPQLLSRSIEDSATVTSVLIPWNTCGMTQATVLGVATITYLPYCFFNLLSPLMTLLVAAIKYKIPSQHIESSQSE